ncbi:MAG: hypothetical protein Q9168_003370 [Polycauliona sp. 1 TL-2023]
MAGEQISRPKHDWSRTYAGSEEISQYFDDFKQKYKLERFIRLQHLVTEAQWLDADGLWKVEGTSLQDSSSFRDTCHILINASGYLNTWAWPDISGRNDFEGQLVHSANWNDEIDLQGKNVALVGNGSSAVQLLPEIQSKAHVVTTFMRSPLWVLPSIGDGQQVYGAEEIQHFKDNPEALLRVRKLNEAVVNSIFSLYLSNSILQSQLKIVLADEMRRAIQNKAIEADLIPEWGVGCRRLAPGVGYLEALLAANVQKVHKGVVKFTKEGCKTSDGTVYPVDIIVCATGFDTSFVPSFPIRGHDGINLQSAWKECPSSYLGIAVSGFPNYFMFLGPYSPVANGPTLAGIETQADHILALIDRYQTENIHSMTPKATAQADFCEHVASFMKGAVYSEGCRSGHKNHTVNGRVPTLWPGSTLHYMEALREVRADDWDMEYDGNRFAWLGNGISQTEFDPTSDLGCLREVIQTVQPAAITLTDTRDSSDGSSVSEKHSLQASVYACDDNHPYDLGGTGHSPTGPTATSPSNAPPPFSSLNISPEHSASRIKLSVAEPDFYPPPPFASTNPVQAHQPPASQSELATEAELASNKEGEPSAKSAEDKDEPPPPYTEGSSPLGSFTYVMAAAGGPASIITQVPQGGPPTQGGHTFADVGPDENISLDLRGTKFILSRDELLTLPEFVLLSLFPNGLLPDGHMNSFHEGDTYPVDYDPASLQYMLDFFRTVAQTIPSSSPSPTTDTPSTDTTMQGSARDMLQDRAGIIVLREDLDFYAIPPKADIDQPEMIEVKRAAGRALLKQDGIFSGLRKSEEAGTTEQHLIEMLTAGGFYNDDRWGHRASEPNKAVICSLALARLRTDIKGNDLANSNAVGMAQKLLLFWRKPARRCWWEGVELENVDGVDGKLKVWIRRVWTLEMTLDDLATRKLHVLRQLAGLSAVDRGPQCRSDIRRASRGANEQKPNHLKIAPFDIARRSPHPAAKRVLDGLPSPTPGHRRRVPTMINANHIPFLRFKKPQSPFLSHIIRKKTDEREKRIARTQRLERLVPFAEDEDRWDEIVKRTNGISSNDRGITWTCAIHNALTHVKRVHKDNSFKRMHIARRMFDIMEEERKMADQEKRMRRDKRHQAYKARRKLREATSTAEQIDIIDDHTPIASAVAAN